MTPLRRSTPRCSPAIAARWPTTSATHFLWACTDRVAHITLNRPERKNPLSFESYAELRDLFIALRHAHDVRAIVDQLAPAPTSAPAATCTRSSAR